jgi:predicted DNA-binding transcriptional regulator AlpA
LPKLERLLKLAQLTREQRAGTVREMSQVCGVSQRTIFRYLNTLSSLNLPDELRAGTRKAAGESFSRVIDRDDQCLLCFALDHNPLVQYNYLAGRLDEIKRILSGGRLPGGGVLKGSVIEVESSPGPRKKTRRSHTVDFYDSLPVRRQSCRQGSGKRTGSDSAAARDQDTEQGNQVKLQGAAAETIRDARSEQCCNCSRS